MNPQNTESTITRDTNTVGGHFLFVHKVSHFCHLRPIYIKWIWNGCVQERETTCRCRGNDWCTVVHVFNKIFGHPFQLFNFSHCQRNTSRGCTCSRAFWLCSLEREEKDSTSAHRFLTFLSEDHAYFIKQIITTCTLSMKVLSHRSILNAR